MYYVSSSLHLKGVEHSLPLDLAKKCKELSNVFHTLTHFPSSAVDPDEIKRLSKRFKRLDLNKDGSLSLDEFMSIPELQQNPLVKRVIDILDTDRNGAIDFQGINNNRIYL